MRISLSEYNDLLENKVERLQRKIRKLEEQKEEGMVEASLVTYRSQILDYNKGTPTSVEFNFERIWNFKKQLKGNFCPKYLEFYHVHPRGLLEMSQLDINCVQGLVVALGEPIFFNIITFDNDDLYDINISYMGYGYYKETNRERYTIPLITDDQLYLLKSLAYGNTKS